jgi:hypothetical protein
MLIVSRSASRKARRTSDVWPDSQEFAPHVLDIQERATPAPTLYVALDLVHPVRGCSACPEEVQERRVSTNMTHRLITVRQSSARQWINH